MVGVAQVVEHRVVAPVVVGSSPITHPISKPQWRRNLVLGIRYRLPESASAPIDAERIQKFLFFTNNEYPITNNAELSMAQFSLRARSSAG